MSFASLMSRASGVTENYDNYEFENFEEFQNTLEGWEEIDDSDVTDGAEETLDTICAEAAHGLNNIQLALSKTEIALENMMIEQGTDIEPILESTGKEFFSKIKQKIMAFWKKIQKWFKYFTESVKNFFTKGENLVAKYGSDIDAAAKKLNVDVKIYDYDEMGALSKYSEIAGKLESTFRKVTARISGTTNSEIAESMKSKSNDSLKLTEHWNKDAVLKEIGCESASDVAKSIKKAAGLDEKKTMNLKNVDMGRMKSQASMDTKTLKSLKESEGKINAQFKDLLKGISKAEKSLDDKKKAVASGFISRAVETGRFIITLRCNALKAYVAAAKSCKSGSTAIIRTVLSKAHRPVKEGFMEIDAEDNTEVTTENSLFLANLAGIEM